MAEETNLVYPGKFRGAATAATANRLTVTQGS